jgi:RES domain-containing protein
MQVYRACSERFRAFDGEGAYRYGGRWNRPGVRVVYTASSRALAVLESLAHLHEAPDDYVLVEATIPDEIAIKTVNRSELRPGWMNAVAGRVSREIGDAWIERKQTAVLLVPSTIIPEEFNVLLNPNHADFRKVRIAEAVPFRFDMRLFR